MLNELSAPEQGHAGNRVLVIGLDGATFRVLNPLCNAGLMPNLQRLMDQGAFGLLQSTVPPISAAAWTTFITGKNPGKHGILHFVALDWLQQAGATEDSVEISPGTFAVVNASSIKEATLWRMVSEAGKRVAVINVPMTYPPTPLNGLMITSMLTPPGAKEFTYPPELKNELQGYQIDLELKDKEFDSLSPDVIRQVRELMDNRGRTALRLLQKEPWDLFVVVFTETDRIQHRFIQFLDPTAQAYDSPEAQEYRPALHSFYGGLDTWIGALVEQAGEGVDVVILSDHGFTSMAERRVYTHALAREIGLFSMHKASWTSRLRVLVESAFGVRRRQAHRVLSRVLPRAFVDRIFEGLRRRERVAHTAQRGRVVKMQQGIGGVTLNPSRAGSDSTPALADLRLRLQQLQDPVNGAKLVKKVALPEEIYSGPFTKQLPQLVFFLEEGYGLSSGTGRRGRIVEYQSGEHQRQGTHDQVGILILQGPDIGVGRLTGDLYIQDATSTILHLLGLPIPLDLDGHVLEEALDARFARLHPVRRSEAVKAVEGPCPASYSLDEEEALRARLRSLGYID